MKDSREKIVQTASRLLEEQGYHATGLNQIVEESGAPKGSLYYYFPDGKAEISEVALRGTGRDVASNIRDVMDDAASAGAGVRELIRVIADRMEAADFHVGGPITTVALESAPEENRLTKACRDIYREWHAVLRTTMVADGIEPPVANRLSRTVLSAIEGAMVLARTHSSRQPLDDAAHTLGDLIDGTT